MVLVDVCAFADVLVARPAKADAIPTNSLVRLFCMKRPPGLMHETESDVALTLRQPSYLAALASRVGGREETANWRAVAARFPEYPHSASLAFVLGWTDATPPFAPASSRLCAPCPSRTA